MLLTRAPLYSSPCGDFLVRLACVRHAASVDSEPGSNSRLKPEISPQKEGRPPCPRRSAGMTYLVRSLELALKHFRGPPSRLAAGQKSILTTGTFNLFVKDRIRNPPERHGSVENESRPRAAFLVLETCPQQIALPLEANLLNISRLAEICQPELPFLFTVWEPAGELNATGARRQQTTLPQSRRPTIDTSRSGRTQIL